MSDDETDDIPRDVPRVRLVRILNHDADDENRLDNYNIRIAALNDPVFMSEEESASASSPVIGESFCDCFSGRNGRINCKCGEEDNYHEWSWDGSNKSKSTRIHVDVREVLFHVEYSCGTAAIRGNKPMENKQYYWEIKMTTPVYGTDMMVGVGTSHVNLDKHRYSFVSLLGSDSESWGLSYTGKIYHKGQCHQYAPQFGQGSIIGIHLDMWNGTLSFFKNRKPLGVAYSGLQGKTLYPMVSSTAARSGMKVVRSRSFDSSLQFLCCCKLREIIPPSKSVLEVVNLPPGLKAFLDNNLSWLLGPTCSADKDEQRLDTDSSKSSETDSTSRKQRKRMHSFSSRSQDDENVTCKHLRKST